MSTSVPTANVRELDALIAAQGLHIRFKEEGYAAWWHAVASWFVIAMLWTFRLLSCGTFIKRYSDFTTVLGDSIYIGSPRAEFDPRKPSTHATLRHELIHAYQRAKHGAVVFSLLYLFCAPAVFTWRHKFEKQAYLQQLIVEFETYGDISAATIEWAASQFWSPAYLWMKPFKAQIREAFTTHAQAIKEGDIKGLWPYKPEALR